MALRKIITLENEILRKVSKPVTRFDENLWDLLDDMKETLIKSTGVGLAAPQVAVLKRVFVLMVRFLKLAISRELQGIYGLCYQVIRIFRLCFMLFHLT